PVRLRRVAFESHYATAESPSGESKAGFLSTALKERLLSLITWLDTPRTPAQLIAPLGLAGHPPRPLALRLDQRHERPRARRLHEGRGRVQLRACGDPSLAAIGCEKRPRPGEPRADLGERPMKPSGPGDRPVRPRERLRTA